MFKTTILCLLFAAGVCTVKAQTATNQDTTHRHRNHAAWQGHSGPQAWQGHRNMSFHGRGERVHYTPDQRKQLMAINSDYRKKQQDLYKQDNLTLGAYKAQLVTLQKDRKAKTQALLTPGQKQQLARHRQKASENQQVMAAAHLERMKIDLQLSDDQAAKIKSQQADFRTQLQTIRGDDNLLPEQKREQMMALFSKQKDALASVLTPDQQAKLKTEHHAHFGHRGMHRPGRPGGPGGPSGDNAPANF